MRYFAKAAVAGGAVGIRALCEEIPEIKEEVNVPVIGLTKRVSAESSVYITPGFEDIDKLAKTGCDVIAMDLTMRKRPNNVTAEELINYARANICGIELMADTDCIESAEEAEKLGFDYIGTTMRGYTEKTRGAVIPDFEFLKELSKIVKNAKWIAEGGIWEPEQLEKISDLKPYAVVIGTAITRPKDITERFAGILKNNL